MIKLSPQPNAIIEKTFAVASEKGLKPLSVAVLDSGGHLLAFQKQDGASMLRFEIAFGKAYGALAVGFGSRWLETTSLERPHFIAGLTAVSGGRVVPVPAGVLIRNNGGEVIGAVGMTRQLLSRRPKQMIWEHNWTEPALHLEKNSSSRVYALKPEGRVVLHSTEFPSASQGQHLDCRRTGPGGSHCLNFPSGAKLQAL